MDRLFYLQIIDDDYKLKSENNAIKIVYEYPERGYVYDRNDKLLIANQPSYDLMVIPNEIKNMDTLAFCKLVDISKEEFDKILKKAINHSRRLPSPFLTQLNRKDFAAFQEKIGKYKGFEIQKISDTENPVYAVKFDENQHPIICFSKTYFDEFNPKTNFSAIMTCNNADEGCPMVFGADSRFPIKYDDPKAFDGTELMNEKYAERSLQIASEMYYVFSQIN